MEDRELLEFAAKAFWREELDDVSLRWCEKEQCILYIHADNQDHNGIDREFRWAPHEEDADSFQLAIKLRLDIIQDTTSVTIKRWITEKAESFDLACVRIEDCRFAATRLAVLFAAAEIGKAMP